MQTGPLYKAEFRLVVGQYGGTTEQDDELFDTFDVDHDGTICHSELLSGVANATPDMPLRQITAAPEGR
jgi:Ca2+-binding EF-hand superfamily protein